MIVSLLALLKAPFIFAACENTFFLIPSWWEYLPKAVSGAGCTTNFRGGFDINGIWLIGLAVIDMLLRVAGMVAVIAILIAGVRYITAQGNAEKTTSARRSIIRAVTGLTIALVATAFVAFLGKTLGG